MTNFDETFRAAYGFDAPSIDLAHVLRDGKAASDLPVRIPLRMMNRHGMIAGSTGTGKTRTLQLLAEQLSRNGVPVFLADVKGDVAGLAMAGTSNDKLQARVAEIGIGDYASQASPVVFWDLFGKLGHPVRTTVSEMGPTLLSRVL